MHYNLAEWLTIVGFPLTLLGVLIAIGEARSSRTAASGARVSAEAAQEAAERAERRIGDNQLLLMIPQMSIFRRELDLAVDRPDRQETLRLLGDWPTLASELQGVLARLDAEVHTKLIGDLRRSVRLTGKAKDAIIAEKAEIVSATSKARELIHETCGSASIIIGAMKMGASSDG